MKGRDQAVRGFAITCEKKIENESWNNGRSYLNYDRRRD